DLRGRSGHSRRDGDSGPPPASDRCERRSTRHAARARGTAHPPPAWRRASNGYGLRPVKERLTSLDAFRGVTIAAMILVNNPGNWAHVYAQLQHADWHGLTLADLVFPFFLFIVGTAMVLAFRRQEAFGVPRGLLTLRALRRGTVLVALGLGIAGFRRMGLVEQAVALGVLVGCGLLALRLRGALREVALIAVWSSYAAFELQGPGIRVPGVLQRIGVCFFLASAAYLWLPRRSLPWIVGIVLVAYHAALAFVPVPGHGAGRIDDPAGNLASWIDRLLLDGHLWIEGVRDPEGPLHTFPATCTVLLGTFAGEVLVGPDPPASRVRALLVRGAVLAALGFAWSFL